MDVLQDDGMDEKLGLRLRHRKGSYIGQEIGYVH